MKRASARLGGSELQGSSALLLDLVGIPEFLAAVVIVLFMLCPCHHPTTPSDDRFLTFHDVLIREHGSSLGRGESKIGKSHRGGEAEGDCEPAQAASDEPPNSLEWTGKLLVPSKVLCSYIQICEHIQPLLVHYFIPGHAVKMNTAVCNFPFGLEFVNQKVGVGRLQIACNYWAEKLKGGSSICNLGCQGEKCNLSCPVLAAMCWGRNWSYLTLTL